MNPNPVIDVRGLSKNFGQLKAVEDLSFQVKEGEIYGLLGENGAGKSTLMRMMLGLVHPDQGTVAIFGTKVDARHPRALAKVGAIIERPDLYNYLSAQENIRLFAGIAGHKISSAGIERLLELTGLQRRGNDKVKTYSLGMKQRLAIAVALAHDPPVLILDEPVNGLDPQGIADIRVLIKRLSEEEAKTIMLSSHLLHEVEQIATRVLIMHRGRRMAEGSLADLSDPAKTVITINTTDPALTVLHALEQSVWKGRAASAGHRQVRLQLHPDEAARLNTFLVGEGIGVSELRAVPSLESLFLELTAEPSLPA